MGPVPQGETHCWVPLLPLVLLSHLQAAFSVIPPCSPFLALPASGLLR